MAGFNSLVNRYRESIDPLSSERKVEMVALILSVILVILLVFNLLRLLLPGRPNAMLPAADTLAVVDMPSASQVSPQLSSRVRARPVFWPSRRAPQNLDVPQVVEKETGAGAASALDDVELRGIFGGGSSAGIIALVKGEKKRVMLGSKVLGWQLKSIDGDRVTFSDKGKSKELSLIRSAAAARE